MRWGTFAGRLGGDAELGATPSGVEVCKFSVAVDAKQKGGEKRTVWVTCKIWQDRAAKVAPYLKKGGHVTVAGLVDTEAWTDKNGNARASLVCDVRELTFGGGGDREEAAASSRGRVQPSGDFDDDIPF